MVARSPAPHHAASLSLASVFRSSLRKHRRRTGRRSSARSRRFLVEAAAFSEGATASLFTEPQRPDAAPFPGHEGGRGCRPSLGIAPLPPARPARPGPAGTAGLRPVTRLGDVNALREATLTGPRFCVFGPFDLLHRAVVPVPFLLSDRMRFDPTKAVLKPFGDSESMWGLFKKMPVASRAPRDRCD